MTRKRSRLEIYLDVLRAVKSGVNKPTGIMYRCNLSWTTLNKILASLTNQNLIQAVWNEQKKSYVITGRGRQALTYFEKAPDIAAISVDVGKSSFQEPVRHS